MSTRGGVSTQGALIALLAGLAAGCDIPDVNVGGPPGPGDAPSEEVPVEERVAARSLQVARCGGSGLVPDFSGVYVFAFETVSTVGGGNLARAQTEAVTRYGVAQLCQTDDQLAAAVLTCTFDQGPLLDNTGTCAAQMPTGEVLAALDGVQLQGTVDVSTQSAVLNGFEERWGLPPQADLPAAGMDGLLDQDADGDPGVTLFGNGPVPSIAWAARLTTARIDLQVGNLTTLGGRTTSDTAQRIVGGPAQRLLDGRTRTPEPGTAIFVRADGIDGSAAADQNRDGFVSCAEVAPWIGAALPLPRAPACTP